MNLSMIVMLLAAVLAAAVVELAELILWFDRMFRDAKIRKRRGSYERH